MWQSGNTQHGPTHPKHIPVKELGRRNSYRIPLFKFCELVAESEIPRDVASHLGRLVTRVVRRASNRPNGRDRR